MNTVKTLLADDHAIVRAGIHDALAELPNLEFVAEVGDGNALREALQATTPDFLIIDVSMPHFEPLSAVKQIRQQYPAMKILVISAYDDDVYVQGLLGIGVDGYHLKDQSLADLRLAVQRVLAGERWVTGRLVGKLVTPKPSQTTPSHDGPVLTPRQREILIQLRQGHDNQTIANNLNLSIKTVENHLTKLYRQLNVQSRLEAASYIAQHPNLLALATPSKTRSLPAMPQKSTLTILTVDDSMRYRQQLRRMINIASPLADVYEASNIADTLSLAQRIDPDIVFVDVVLGDESGLHCTQQLRNLLPDLRVVLISAYPDREFRKQGLRVGALAFLDKQDIDTPSLRQLLDDLAP